MSGLGVGVGVGDSVGVGGSVGVTVGVGVSVGGIKKRVAVASGDDDALLTACGASSCRNQ